MITYAHGSGMYQTLFRVHGSALYKGIVPALMSTIVLLILEFASDEPTHEIETRWFTHRTYLRFNSSLYRLSPARSNLPYILSFFSLSHRCYDSCVHLSFEFQVLLLIQQILGGMY